VNPLAVALVWAGTGVLSALLLPRMHQRRLGVVTPLAGLVALVVMGAAAGSPAGVGIGSLDRFSQGLLIATAASLVAAFLQAPVIRGSEPLTIGVAGGAMVIALSTGSLAVRGLAFLLGAAAIALRWAAVAPGRATLSAGRVTVSGAAALLAAAVFLPLTGSAVGPRPIVVGVLLACGFATLIALLPLGGWAATGFAAVRGIDVAPWPLLLAPVALLSAEAAPVSLPDAATTVYGQILLAAGLFTAVWSGLMALRTPLPARYGRVFIADMGLAAAAIGSGRGAIALSGGLLVVLTHLTLGPLLLASESGPPRGPQRAAWALLCGVPPSPSFWARFLLLEALVQADVATLLATVPAVAAAFIASVLAAVPAAGHGTDAPARDRLGRELIGWVLVAAGLALALVPEAAASVVFGGR
jgi:hypothetical protein